MPAKQARRTACEPGRELGLSTDRVNRSADQVREPADERTRETNERARPIGQLREPGALATPANPPNEPALSPTIH